MKEVNPLDNKLGGMERNLEDLNESNEKQVVLIHKLADALKQQADNSVPLRQKVAELEARLEEVERKVS